MRSTGSLFGMYAIAAVLSLPIRGFAIPVQYDEAVNGDLGISPLTVLNLDTGVNTIRGSGGLLSTGSDLDSFTFVVPVGAEVTSATYTIEAFSHDPITIGATAQYNFPLLSEIDVVDLFSAQTVQNLLVNSLPLGAGSYDALNGFSINAPPNGLGSFSVDYLITLNLAPSAVPEPASIPLLVLALGLVWLFRSRAKVSCTTG